MAETVHVSQKTDGTLLIQVVTFPTFVLSRVISTSNPERAWRWAASRDGKLLDVIFDNWQVVTDVSLDLDSALWDDAPTGIIPAPVFAAIESGVSNFGLKALDSSAATE